LEIETLVRKPGLRAFGHALPLRYRDLENPPVLAKDIIDVSYIVILVAVLAVVKSIAAIVVAKFLIDSTFHRFTACQASAFRCFHRANIHRPHPTTNGYKYLYT